MIVVALALATLVGAAVGLLGGGGATLALPLYLYVLGLAPRDAIAATLVTVAATSSIAAVVHARAGNLDGRVALWFGAAGAGGGYVGGRATAWIPAPILLAGFAALLLSSAVRMLVPPANLTPRAAHPARAAALGALVGLISGLAGVGGGFLVVPALIFAGGLTTRRAIGTSAAVTAAQAAAGAAGHLGHASLDLRVVAPVIATACLASVLAVRVGRALAPRALQVGLAIMLFAVAGLLAEREIPSPWGHVGVGVVTALATATALVVRRTVSTD